MESVFGMVVYVVAQYAVSFVVEYLKGKGILPKDKPPRVGGFPFLVIVFIDGAKEPQALRVPVLPRGDELLFIPEKFGGPVWATIERAVINSCVDDDPGEGHLAAATYHVKLRKVPKESAPLLPKAKDLRTAAEDCRRVSLESAAQLLDECAVCAEEVES